ncbi:hypothetical protein ACFQ4N_09195 [Oceanobacillus iheyensis]|uniref:hypothetical protein n=1 Tax=Oceanobacillus iheyensis TaxID=182710 RepID=UPI0003233826|nr:hypothetical protein [Oceanobacillus iheyensis]
MRKNTYLVMCSAMILILVSGCQKEYIGEYIQWGVDLSLEQKDLLKDNDIPIKVDGSFVYIPRDAVDDATYCCS